MGEGVGDAVSTGAGADVAPPEPGGVGTGDGVRVGTVCRVTSWPQAIHSTGAAIAITLAAIAHINQNFQYFMLSSI